MAGQGVKAKLQLGVGLNHWAKSPPEYRVSGNRLIGQKGRHDLAGGVKLDYASNGFSADFSIPLDRGIQA